MSAPHGDLHDPDLRRFHHGDRASGCAYGRVAELSSHKPSIPLSA